MGSVVVERLTEMGHGVVGINNINDYYDISLKHARLDRIGHPLFKFIKMDIAEREAIPELFVNEQFDRVSHLAAQAGGGALLD